MKYLDELQASLNNAEHTMKLMDSKVNESNTFGNKCREQIDYLLENENNLKIKFKSLKEENAVLKLNSNRFVIMTITIIRFYKYLNINYYL